ncbi:MAG: tRNA (adenosine(37)-N6)-threonylcarbamoyltransferase complex ATPase subunit type 1 TsaE [Muribaculaceae bacterium]|nr:tRNA (adenosine(37)-N6)-threonylcarbamoyltransferase complex ATPase subunit type 1 TsaE [Muribaculaceae bacterium]
MKIEISSLAALPEAAGALLSAAGSRRVFAFHAPMGAGKTTLIAEMCRQLGADDDSASPTFSILNEYRSRTSGESIYHFDFYRLESAGEAFDIGTEDYLYSGAYCFLEWPGIVERMLPEDTVDVSITVDPETGVRTLEAEGI